MKLDNITNEELIAMGELLSVEAYERFEKCGSPDDFCVQSYGICRIVFGGLNRLLWSPTAGFVIDELYCSPRFIKNYKKFYS